MGEGSSVLIIGAGQAGAECAFALRKSGFAGAITLAGDEPHLPYERPPLSKAFLTGEADPGRMSLKPAEAFAHAGIDVLPGERIVAIDAGHSAAQSSAGRELPFTCCVFATGARARALPLASAAGALSLRTVEDAAALRERLRPDGRLAIIGGGYIGLEVATVAASLEMRVTVLEAAPTIMPGRLSQPTTARLTELHRARGVVIHANAAIHDITPAGSGVSLNLAGGATLCADTLVCAVGALPDDALARASGIVCGNGILVDALCRTSVSGVYAIGDCATRTVAGHVNGLRIESVYNALHQARLVAAQICGTPLPAQKPPTFWSDQAGIRLQTAGLLTPGVPVVDRLSEAGAGWLVERYQEGVLRVVEAVNHPAGFIQALRRIGAVDPLSTLTTEASCQ